MKKTCIVIVVLFITVLCSFSFKKQKPESIPAGDLREVLNETMADLPPREQGILRRRFGLDGDEPQTLGQIAVDLGITAERVRQPQNAALGRIKKPSKLRRLQAFVE